MKKIYMQPQTEVVKINAEQMICQSGFSKSLNATKIDAGTYALDKDDDFDSSDDLW